MTATAIQAPGRGPLPTPDADAARRAVDAALAADPGVADGLSREPVATGGRDLIEAAIAWFLDLIARIDGLRASSPTLYWLVFLGLVTILALLLWHIAWTVRSAMRGARAVAREHDDREAEVARRRDSAELRSRARALATAGSRREAVQLLVLALLARLDERDVLHAANSQTLREIVARLALRMPGDADLAAFGRGAERAVYGIAEPSAADFEALDTELGRLTAAVDAAAAMERVA